MPYFMMAILAVGCFTLGFATGLKEGADNPDAYSIEREDRQRTDMAQAKAGEKPVTSNPVEP